MTTSYGIITGSLKDIGALAAGEVPTADEAQDAFDMLNDMCAQWANLVFSEAPPDTSSIEVSYT